MRAIVLAGGEGTRLRPLTNSVPKQMLPILERPMIERVISWLSRHDVEEVVLSLGYRPSVFVDAYPSGYVGGVKLGFVIEPELLDTAGAVRYAAESAGLSDTFLVINGDVLTDIDLTALVRFHRERAAEASIAVTPALNPSAYGVVPTDEAGRVLEFVEKPPPDDIPSDQINAGLYVLEPTVLKRIAAARRVSIERETFPELVAEQSLYALRSTAYWLDTGTPASYIAAQLDILAGRRPVTELPPFAPRRTGVYVDAGARVEGDLEPSCYVGAGASVAAKAAVAASVVGSSASVGAASTVTGSVLVAGATVAGGCVVNGSIVGPGARLGEGCELSGGAIVGAAADVPAGTVLDGERFPART